MRKLTFFSLLLTLITFSPIYASIFTYYASEITIQPVHPSIMLWENGYKYVCTGISRTRTALTYTDFEALPIGWAWSGGTWTIVSGFKGNALRGADDSRGLGGASHYYYNIDLSTYQSLWVTVKTRRVSGSGWYGISMFNSEKSRLYTIEIYTGGYIEVWSFNVEGSSWHQLARARIAGYSTGNWYVILSRHTVTPTSVTFEVYVYDAYTGSLVATVFTSSTSPRRFTPAYIGVEVDGPTADFEDFEIATGDPRHVSVVSLPEAGYAVRIIDDLNNIVAHATSTGTSVSLDVVRDIIVGRGYDGRIEVLYPDSSPCLVYRASDVILGGDSYSLAYGLITVTIGSNRASARVTAPISGSDLITTYTRILIITNHDGKPYYLRLVLVGSTSIIQATLTLHVFLETSLSTSTPIEIVAGSIVSSETSWVTILAGANTYIRIEGYHSTSGQTSRLTMLLQYCTLPGEQGVCVYYPVELVVSS